MGRLNDAQRDAVFSDASRILCLAGAGTGKTLTLVERISRLIAAGVDPTSILCITFTNAGAFEMNCRFKQKYPNTAIPEFHTFHGFCYHVLISNRAARLKLGFESVPAIADEAAQKRINKQASMQVGIHISHDKLCGKKPMTAQERSDSIILQKAVSRIMKNENTITYDSLLESVSNLFIHDDSVVQGYKKRFKYILVDEFQDTSKIEWQFIQSFESSNIFVVGDALQSLYTFRGADSSIIKSISEDPKWEVIQLEQNYRSTSKICEYANKFTATYAKPTYRLEITSDVPGPDVNVVVASEHAQVRYGQVLDETLESIIKLDSQYTGTSAVLCRTNVESEYIQAYLKQHGVAYVTGKHDDDAQNILKSVLDNTYMIDWLSTYLVAERYSEYLRRRSIKIQECGSYSDTDFIQDFGWVSSIDERLSKIYKIRNMCKDSEIDSDILSVILDTIEYPAIDVDITSCNQLSDILDTVSKQIEESCITQSDLYVGTVHSVKGLEYDNVYVVGVDGPSFKLINEENNNIFYVAITRARRNLTVYMGYEW